jgi:hypothetical protein
MSVPAQHWHRLARVACLCALGCCFAGPALALELAADLSSHHIEIRTTFKGAQITVFGSVSGDIVSEAVAGGADVIVVVRGPPESLAIRRKGRLGFIWANEASLTAKNVPSYYYVASTRPVGDILDRETLARYGIGTTHLGISFAQAGGAARTAQAAKAEANRASSDDLLDLGAPGREENAPAEAPAAVPAPLDTPLPPSEAQIAQFRAALFRILQQRHVFSEHGHLSVIRSHLFRTELNIPSTVPAGAYNADIYLVKDRAVRDAESLSFFIDKKGIERDIYTLAMHHPILHGILAVVIAVTAGWLSEAALRRR